MSIKKLFPMAFTEKQGVGTLIIDIIIHSIFGFVVYMIGDLLPSLGPVGIVLMVLCRCVGVYLIISMILAILNFFKVIK